MVVVPAGTTQLVGPTQMELAPRAVELPGSMLSLDQCIAGLEKWDGEAQEETEKAASNVEQLTSLIKKTEDRLAVRSAQTQFAAAVTVLAGVAATLLMPAHATIVGVVSGLTAGGLALDAPLRLFFWRRGRQKKELDEAVDKKRAELKDWQVQARRVAKALKEKEREKNGQLQAVEPRGLPPPVPKKRRKRRGKRKSRR